MSPQQRVITKMEKRGICRFLSVADEV